MRRILIFRESVRSKLSINFGEEVTFGEMFDSVSVEDSEIILYNIDNIRKVESFDIRFTEIINEHSAQKFDLIVIPAWLGNPLQYNGLNLAMHWRLSENNASRFSSILIYSFLDELTVFKNCNFAGFLNSDYVSYKNILGLEINSMLNDIKLAESNKYDLEKNLKCFNVLPPSNYKTNHSITNEWSILQWSKALKIDKNNASLLKVEESINSLLYYKYLRAKFSLSGSAFMPAITLQNKGKILFIDDEMEKGWEIIFKKITSNFDKNNVHFFGSKFKGYLNPDEIVNEIENTVKDTKIDPDVVVLDLRLHDNDYDEKTKINESTGYKALKKIKEHNRGIQVIILTASNKIWNMQALQNIEIKEKGIIVGADGFIVKESPENSSDPKFTEKSLKNIYNTIETCFEKSFLSTFYQDYYSLHAKLTPRKNFKTSPNPLPKDFVSEILKWLDLSYNVLQKELNISTLTTSFLFLFSVLENLANYVVDVDNPIEIDKKPGKFKFEFRVNKQRLRRFTEEESNNNNYRKTKTILECSRNIPWNQKILNTLDFITNESISNEDLSLLISKRNDIIHSNITTGNKIKINTNDILFLNNILIKGLFNI